MKPIVHVVTYVSVDGAFGGPVAVARAQAQELASRGHKVALVAGWDGHAEMAIPGVDLKLFRANKLWPKLTGLFSISLWLFLLLRAPRGAVFHVHLGRDILSLIGARILSLKPNVTLFVQTHGMVMPKESRFVQILDIMLTIPILRKSTKVFVLTLEEEAGIQRVAAPFEIQTQVIPNGVPKTSVPSLVRDPRRLLFFSRLHPRKRVKNFAEMCLILRDRGVDFSAKVVGPDEGDAEQLLAFIRANELSEFITYEGPVPSHEAAKVLAESQVMVLPSHGEVFPMSVLEAMSSGTAVVTTQDTGMAPLLRSTQSAKLTDGTPHALAEAVEPLLGDSDEWRALVKSGSSAIETTFSIAAVVDQLCDAYEITKGGFKQCEL